MQAKIVPHPPSPPYTSVGTRGRASAIFSHTLRCWQEEGGCKILTWGGGVKFAGLVILDNTPRPGGGNKRGAGKGGAANVTGGSKISSPAVCAVRPASLGGGNFLR